MEQGKPMEQHFSEKWGSSLYLHHCGFERCAPSHSFGPAVRDHYLVHCILSGKGVYEVNGKRYALSAGQGFLIVPGVVTTYTADGEEPWYYCWAGFQGSDAPGLLRACGADGEQPVMLFRDKEKVEHCIDALCQSNAMERNPFFTVAKLYEFLSLLYKGEKRQGTAGETIFLAASEFMTKNYSYPLSIVDLAAHVGVDRSHLFRIFKRECGVSPQQYLLGLRLEKAAELLRDTELTVTEVMYSCGFNDLPNFSRQFHKHFGLSPSRKRSGEDGGIVEILSENP